MVDGACKISSINQSILNQGSNLLDLLLSPLVGALLAVRCDPFGWRGGFWGFGPVWGCHPPTHLFDPFLQPRREDSAAHTVQPASPVSSDERGEGQFRWKPQGFRWEYSSGVALALIALESRACVPLLDSLEGGEPRS